MITPLVFSMVRGAFSFIMDCFGIINRPYETIRRLSIKTSLTPVFFFGLLIWLYFSLAVIVKFGLTTGAMFLTFNLGRLIYAVIVLYLGITVSMYLVGRIFGGRGSMWPVFTTWLYSYLPTLIWFFLTTVLYIILPPPRTQSLGGQLFTIFYLFISLILLFWKIILYFLTLRFCLKLNMWQIVRSTLVLWPFYVFLFILFNRLEIFKIPFV